MKIADKLVEAFNDKYKPDDVEGYKVDTLMMILHEFSNLYQVKRYVLAKELA